MFSSRANFASAIRLDCKSKNCGRGSNPHRMSGLTSPFGRTGLRQLRLRAGAGSFKHFRLGPAWRRQCIACVRWERERSRRGRGVHGLAQRPGREILRVAIVLAAHTSKSSSTQVTHLASGSTAWVWQARSALVLKQETDGAILLPSQSQSRPQNRTNRTEVEPVRHPPADDVQWTIHQVARPADLQGNPRSDRSGLEAGSPLVVIPPGKTRRSIRSPEDCGAVRGRSSHFRNADQPVAHVRCPFGRNL